jgi:hypothetical protein
LKYEQLRIADFGLRIEEPSHDQTFKSHGLEHSAIRNPKSEINQPSPFPIFSQFPVPRRPSHACWNPR